METSQAQRSKTIDLLSRGELENVCPLIGRYLKISQKQGSWVAQSIKHPTLDFGSGHDLTVRGIEPRVGLCAYSMEPA